jgi:hypothetical protein
MNLADLTPAGRALKVLDFLWDHWLVILLGAALAYSVIAGLGKDATIASLQGALSTAQAEKATLQQGLDTAVAARTAAETIAKQRLDILERERADHARVRDANLAAIKAAEAARIDAERTLGTFMDRYAEQLRNPECVTTLNRLEAS